MKNRKRKQGFKSADMSLGTKASDMGGSNLLTRISSGDLVAIEAKYYFSCLTEYTNRHVSPSNVNRTSKWIQV